MNVTSAAMLTRKVSVYSMTVMPALSLTAQGPNSSSLRPLPPLPSVTHIITSRYIADTVTTVSTASQIEAPKRDVGHAGRDQQLEEGAEDVQRRGGGIAAARERALQGAAQFIGDGRAQGRVLV